LGIPFWHTHTFSTQPALDQSKARRANPGAHVEKVKSVRKGHAPTMMTGCKITCGFVVADCEYPSYVQTNGGAIHIFNRASMDNGRLVPSNMHVTPAGMVDRI
jgi:hypothetical protein